MNGREFRNISDDELEASLGKLLTTGARLEARIVAHLAELEERRLHLLAGYSSLFDYCRKRLGLSDYEAFTRIAAARAARKYPVIFEMLEQRRLHLTAICEVREFLTAENHRELLEEISGQTMLQIREILARRFPRADVRANLKKLPELDPLSPGRYRLLLTWSAEQKDKLELARALLSHANPSGDLAVVVERALDALIAQLEKRRFGQREAPTGTKPSIAEPTGTKPSVAEPTGTKSVDVEANAPQSRGAAAAPIRRKTWLCFAMRTIACSPNETSAKLGFRKPSSMACGPIASPPAPRTVTSTHAMKAAPTLASQGARANRGSRVRKREEQRGATARATARGQTETETETETETKTETETDRNRALEQKNPSRLPAFLLPRSRSRSRCPPRSFQTATAAGWGGQVSCGPTPPSWAARPAYPRNLTELPGCVLRGVQHAVVIDAHCAMKGVG